MAKSPQNSQLEQAHRLLQAGRLPEAEKLLRKLVRRDPKLVDGLHLLGQLVSQRGLYDEALQHFNKCLRLRPQVSRYPYALAQACEAMGRVREAIEWYDKALELEPENLEYLGWKAQALETKGDAEAALAIVSPYVEAGTATAEMTGAYVRAKQRLGQHEEAARVAQENIEVEAATAGRGATFAYLAAKSLERLGRYDEAFAAYQAANGRETAPADPELTRRSIDAMIEAFSAAAMPKLPRAQNESTRPVFIVGLPRSGTTLIEQIIDAHPQAAGIGENGDITRLLGAIRVQLRSQQLYPAFIPRLTQPIVNDAAKDYLQRLQKMAPKASRVVSKSLMNWYNLGFISLLFPQAYFIDCRRDPVDNCTSCYMSPLDPRQHPYTTDLANLGIAYREYERLMRHWQEAAQVKIIRVQYEQLVADLDSEAKRMIEFLELPWDEACARFHESGRTAVTLSYEQVQQPVYRSSVGRAERFGAHLDPLRQALAEAQERC
ncbi:MAG: tetratricopeptide repeat-containing sulfotransferase family protein [Phycisphaerales bacterium JB038]